jgi:hypothetical protein
MCIFAIQIHNVYFLFLKKTKTNVTPSQRLDTPRALAGATGREVEVEAEVEAGGRAAGGGGKGGGKGGGNSARSPARKKTRFVYREDLPVTRYLERSHPVRIHMWTVDGSPATFLLFCVCLLKQV